MFYEPSGEDVQCLLCPHGCCLKPGQTGICQARQNIGGELYSLSYGKVSSVALDPVEKKPLRLFHPGKKILSVGSFGCNFKCPYCQNWRISQALPACETMEPQALVDMALGCEGNIGIAYTYNEPLIGYEFVYDTALLAREAGLKNVLVTNGYIRLDPLIRLLPHIDAMNIDLKGSREFYQKNCKGQQDYVKQTILLSAKMCHVEVTLLLVPGENDTAEDVEDIAQWLSSVSADIPLHITRYHPDYEMAQPALPTERAAELAQTAKKYLQNVFAGNFLGTL